MRKRLPYLAVVLVIPPLAAAPVLAYGGNGTNAVAVSWKRNPSTEVWANFQVTRSGIVHEFRYAPEHVHGVFKPKTKFPTEPDERDWFSWTAHNYGSCDPATEYSIMDFLEPGTDYWVKLESQD